MTETEKRIGVMRTKAWVSAVARSLTPNGEETLSTNALRSRDWFTKGGPAGVIRFDRFVSGETVVSEMTVKLVDNCIEYEAAQGKSTAPLFACKDVFHKGPEGIPLWNLLGDECFERAFMSLVDAYLYSDETNPIVQEVFSGKPFSKKVDDLWSRLVGGQPVDFEGYDNGEEGNLLYWRIELGKVAPTPRLFAVLLAARHISEKRRESRSETRYLFDACFGMLGLFDEWNIHEDVLAVIDDWQAPTNPGVIAAVDKVVSRKFAEGGIPLICPAAIGLVSRLVLAPSE